VVTGFELVRSIRTNSVNRDTAVIFISDKVDQKMEYLAKVLRVTAMLTTVEAEFRLEDIVNDCVKTEPDKQWSDLVSQPVKSI
jgi:hypothetical protein